MVRDYNSYRKSGDFSTGMQSKGQLCCTVCTVHWTSAVAFMFKEADTAEQTRASYIKLD